MAEKRRQVSEREGRNVRQVVKARWGRARLGEEEWSTLPLGPQEESSSRKGR